MFRYDKIALDFSGMPLKALEQLASLLTEMPRQAAHLEVFFTVLMKHLSFYL